MVRILHKLRVLLSGFCGRVIARRYCRNDVAAGRVTLLHRRGKTNRRTTRETYVTYEYIRETLRFYEPGVIFHATNFVSTDEIERPEPRDRNSASIIFAYI